jgi:hypothetical protein
MGPIEWQIAPGIGRVIREIKKGGFGNDDVWVQHSPINPKNGDNL